MTKIVLATVVLIGTSLPAMAETEPVASSATGTVYVYRGHSQRTKNIGFMLYANAEAQGRLGSNSYTVLELTPGEHNISSNLPTSEPLRVKVDAGEIAYLSTDLNKKNGKYYTRFSQVSASTAISESPRLAEIVNSTKFTSSQ
ncbi:MAG: DUF2846 domain-containing protein [Pseudomonadales bacterium]